MNNETRGNDFEIVLGDKEDRSDPNVKFGLEKHIASYRDRETEDILSNPEIHPIPEELKEVITAILDFYKAEYKKLGIYIDIHDFVIVQGSSEFFKQRYSGNVKDGTVDRQSGVIVVNDLGVLENTSNSAPEDRELTLRWKALTIAHELYHKLGQRIYATSRDEDKLNISDWREGLSFYSDANKGIRDFALEEGLADIWTDKCRNIVDKAFPIGAEFNKYLLKILPEEAKPKGITITDISKYDRQTGDIIMQYDHYPKSRRLVWMLANTTPEFYLLAERARLHGEIGELANKVDEVYGEGKFNSLLACGEKQAADFLLKD